MASYKAGRILRQLREEAGYKQAEFAAIVGISVGQISYIEGGKRLFSPKVFKAIKASGVFSYDDLEHLMIAAGTDDVFERFGLDITIHVQAPLSFIEGLIRKVKQDRFQGKTEHVPFLSFINTMLQDLLDWHPDDKVRIHRAIGKCCIERIFSFTLRHTESEIEQNLENTLSLLKSVSYALDEPEDIDTEMVIEYKKPYCCGDMEAFNAGMRPLMGQLNSPSVRAMAWKDLVFSTAILYQQGRLSQVEARRRFIPDEKELLLAMADETLSHDTRARCYAAISFTCFRLGLSKFEDMFLLAEEESKKSKNDGSHSRLTEAVLVRTRIDQLCLTPSTDPNTILQYAQKELPKVKYFKRKLQQSINSLITNEHEAVRKYGDETYKAITRYSSLLD